MKQLWPLTYRARGRGWGSEARMTKLTAANQKPAQTW